MRTLGWGFSTATGESVSALTRPRPTNDQRGIRTATERLHDRERREHEATATSGAHGRAGKGLLYLRLQHHDIRAYSQIVRSGDRGLILEDDPGSSRGDIEIAYAGDDADLPSWEREQR
jgi:hypothetical protein